MADVNDPSLIDVLAAARAGDFSVRAPVNGSEAQRELATALNELLDANDRMAAEIRRVGKLVGHDGRIDERAEPPAREGAWKASTEAINDLIDDLVRPTAELARVIDAVAVGDLSQKMALRIEGRPVRGEFLRIRSTVNAMVDRLSSFADEVTRVAREVGTEGKLGGQARVEGVSGVWKDLTDNVNTLAGNLTSQVRNIAEVTTAVANGDLSKRVTVDVRGEVLQLKDTINTMVDQLRSFADEVTRVAREVRTEGKLGGQAQVRGVSGVWRDLTENVNTLAGNLTGQVRNIAQVATAVAEGDLSQKIAVDARGEVLELKDTINTMVDQLSAFADEVTRVAREVGTEGKLGGQAVVPGVSGVWKDLTQNVNSMASNLTGQVRNIAEVTTAVACGDLSQRVAVDARGEVLQLKDTINTMVDQLRSFADEVTRVAREVGTEGKLGGQANVEGVSGVWKDLTDNVNSMASSLTTQVRSIAEVSTAVAQGDLTRSITVDACGEVLDLKDTINQMIANLREATTLLKQQEQDRAKREVAEQRHRRSRFLAAAAASLEQRLDVKGRAAQLAQTCIPELADFAIVQLESEGVVELAAIATRGTRGEALRGLVGTRSDPSAFGSWVFRTPGARMFEAVTPETWSELGLGREGATLCEELRPNAVIAAPLALGRRSLGLLVVGVAAQGGYTDEEVEITKDLARKAAMAVENSRMYEEERDRSKALQLSLLGRPQVTSTAVAAAMHYLPGSAELEVGGDWYDVFERDDGRILVAVGDVVGHGVQAATAMGKLRSAMGALGLIVDSTPELLQRLDQFAEKIEEARFGTVAAVLFDPDTGVLTYSLAGHPPPLVVSADGQAEFLEGGSGLPLAISDGGPGDRPEGRTVLLEGSTIVLYTDGLIERRDDSIDSGLERLRRAVAERSRCEPEQLCDEIVAEFSNGSLDDIVLLCLRREPGDVRVFTRTFPALPKLLQQVRQELRGWLADAGVDARRIDDVVQGCAEACTNVVRHAYGEQAGEATLELRLRGDGTLLARIRDAGRWKTESHADSSGHGLHIMRAVSDHVQVHTTQQGTTVVMEMQVGEPLDEEPAPLLTAAP
jgi:HAMP domain-containing protein/serine phosphatase RsbU (regulator of sigma subunit)/anti-sigma regulatory factor (Ser/Thr protein kinase)